jgi:protein TonB
VAAAIGFLTIAGTVLAAGPRMQVFFPPDFPDVKYQQAVFQKVLDNWKVPGETPKSGSKAVVIAVIRKDGSAPSPRLHHRSGSEAWDASGLEAVRKASPFAPLPKNYPPAAVEVHFHFEFGE